MSAAARKIETTALNLKVKSVQSYSETVRLMNDEFFVAFVGLCLKDTLMHNCGFCSLKKYTCHCFHRKI